MAEIILDLSGKAGLIDGFSGDSDMITPHPELIHGSEKGELAAGLFNPFLRNGYMAPTTTTNTDLTLDVATTTQFGSVEFDHTNENIYWADRLMSIYTGSSLTDTSLTLIDTLSSSTFQGKRYYELHDLQIYQINGVQKLFFTGKGVPTGDGPLTIVAANGVADTYLTAGISIAPFASTKPSIVSSQRNFTAASATTTTQSFTVPSGTNQVLTVVAMWDGSSGSPTATFNGVSMTSELLAQTTTPSVRVFRLVNPTVTTANVVVTWGASMPNRLVYIILTNDTNQTEPVDAAHYRDSAPADTDVKFKMPFTDPNALNLVAAYSDDVMDSDAGDNSSEIYDTTNTFGSDILAVRAETGYGLQVGYTTLPASLFGGTSSSWLASAATGAFLQDLTSNYAFMRNADNGFSYIFADNHVHKIDGTVTGGENGTVTKDVLLFPEFFTITDAVDYRSRMYIVIHQYPVNVAETSLNTYTGKSGIYVWNRISTQLSNADFIELPGVREIKKIFASPDGELRLITISDSGLTELRQFGYNDSGGVVFPAVKTLGVGGYPQFPDGLTTAGDKVVWMGNDGKMYCNKGLAITQLYQAKAPGTTTATLESNITTGAIFYGSGDETGSTGYRSNKQAITYSYLDGSTHVIEKIYPFDLKTGANGSQTPHQGDVYTGVQYIPITSVLRKVRIYNAPITGTGAGVIATVKLYFNQSSTAGMTKSISKDEAKRGYVDFAINKPYIHAIQIEVEWATSEPIGEDMYLPSVAIISHDTTETSSPDSE